MFYKGNYMEIFMIFLVIFILLMVGIAWKNAESSPDEKQPVVMGAGLGVLSLIIIGLILGLIFFIFS